jgi:hypothetical protein
VIASDNGKVIVLRPREVSMKGATVRPAAFTTVEPVQSAPSAPAPAATPPAEPAPVNDITVVGTQIKGSKMTEALPVTVIGKNTIVSTAAVSGDELFHSIPQMGAMTFNSQYLPGSSNSARGDVGAVNLRELGPGNTLVLLNGRRMVQHPVSQADENLVPVISYNTNTIPVGGVERLEVLRDGAAAIYGTDAVAGVVNTVLTSNFKGVSLESQYGFAQGTHMKESATNGTFGHNFEHGNITLFASYTTATPCSPRMSPTRPPRTSGRFSRARPLPMSPRSTGAHRRLAGHALGQWHDPRGDHGADQLLGPVPYPADRARQLRLYLHQRHLPWHRIARHQRDQPRRAL